VSKESIIAAGLLVGGLWLSIHCLRGAISAQRSGIVRTHPFGHEVRRGRPGFSSTVFASYVASLIGMIFVVVGAGMLIVPLISTDL
jgi:hypothetical protein